MCSRSVRFSGWGAAQGKRKERENERERAKERGRKREGERKKERGQKREGEREREREEERVSDSGSGSRFKATGRAAHELAWW